MTAMNSPVCKYNRPYYWERTLQRRDVWNGFFAPPDKLTNPIFINTCVADRSCGFLDNNWACYPGVEALLGFVQYVFLPAVFYYVVHGGDEGLLIPIGSRQKLLKNLRESGSPHKLAMSGFVHELNAIWTRAKNERMRALERFCSRFNRYWEGQDCQLCIHVFFGTASVADKVKKSIWCKELFQEETGLTYRQFDQLCARFQTEDFAKHLLLRLLNVRIGTLDEIH